MFRLDKYRVKIRVVQTNGVYRFGDASASGKSYLSKLLRVYRSYGEPVGVYSYPDYVDGVSLRDRARGCKLFVVDRYDMYYGYALEEIRALGEDCIVLVDIKTPRELEHVAVCGIILKPEEISIT